MRAYFAGCIDCDGSIGIKRSTYALRVRGDAGCPVYSERVMFTQVKPEISNLLVENFGGSLYIQKPGTPNSKPVYKWNVTDKKAIECVKAILPYLQIKKHQAEILLKLRELKSMPRIQNGTYTMTNRFGKEVIMPKRIVSPDILHAKEDLFNQIKSLNDVRSLQPQLIGNGLSGEQVKHKRR